jgi:WS/DGAT/MGAT family acyltransferase
MRQLTDADWTMLNMDSARSQNQVSMIQIYDPSTRRGGRLGFDEILRFVESRLDVSRSFRERLMPVPFALDRPWWVNDANFDLEFHVRELALPDPGDWRQFCTQVGRLASRPLDLTRPPWELYIIERLNGIKQFPRDCFAMMLKMHHSAIDGVAGIQILSALHDLTAEVPRRRKARTSWKPDPLPSSFDMMRRAARSGLSRPVDLAKITLPALWSLRRNDARRALQYRRPALLQTVTRFNGLVSGHIVWGSSFTLLEDVKRIRAAVEDVKVNDVAMAIVGGAIRRYLVDKGEPPQAPLTAMMPIALRATQIQNASGAPVETPAAGNSFVMSPVTLASDVSDPIERLRRIRESTQSAKDFGARSAKALTKLAETAIGGLQGTAQRALVNALNRAGRAAVHTIVTNVPGPQVPIYFCGARALYTSGTGPVVDGIGLFHGIGSYGGYMNICFSADREMMPDPEFYARCIDASLADLLKAANRLSSRSKNPRPARKQSTVTKPRATRRKAHTA